MAESPNLSSTIWGSRAVYPNNWWKNLTITLALTLSVTSAIAHHSFSAEFDANKPVHLEGLVTKVELINPHTWIHIDVTGPNGKVSSWMIEAGSPNVLLRRGITKNTVMPGTRVVVTEEL